MGEQQAPRERTRVGGATCGETRERGGHTRTARHGVLTEHKSWTEGVQSTVAVRRWVDAT
jgi:hypothetical protein